MEYTNILDMFSRSYHESQSLTGVVPMFTFVCFCPFEICLHEFSAVHWKRMQLHYSLFHFISCTFQVVSDSFKHFQTPMQFLFLFFCHTQRNTKGVVQGSGATHTNIDQADSCCLARSAITDSLQWSTTRTNSWYDHLKKITRDHT